MECGVHLIGILAEFGLEGMRCNDLCDHTQVVTEEEGAERRKDADQKLRV